MRYNRFLDDFLNIHKRYFDFKKESKIADEGYKSDLVAFLDKYFPLKLQKSWAKNMRFNDKGAYFGYTKGSANQSVHFPDSDEDVFSEFLEFILVYLARIGVADLSYFYGDLEITKPEKTKEAIISLCDRLIGKNKDTRIDNIKRVMDSLITKDYYDWVNNVEYEIKNIDDKDLKTDIINLKSCGMIYFPLIIEVSEYLGYDFNKDFIRDDYINSIKNQSKVKKIEKESIGF